MHLREQKSDFPINAPSPHFQEAGRREMQGVIHLLLRRIFYGHLNKLQLWRRAALPGVGARHNLWRRDIGTVLFFAPGGNIETPVPVIQKGLTDLTVFGKAHHQLGNAQRQFMVPVDLPSVPCLTIRGDEIGHESMLAHIGHAGCDKHAGFYLVVMAMP